MNNLIGPSGIISLDSYGVTFSMRGIQILNRRIKIHSTLGFSLFNLINMKDDIILACTPSPASRLMLKSNLNKILLFHFFSVSGLLPVTQPILSKLTIMKNIMIYINSYTSTSQTLMGYTRLWFFKLSTSLLILRMSPSLLIMRR